MNNFANINNNVNSNNNNHNNRHNHLNGEPPRKRFRGSNSVIGTDNISSERNYNYNINTYNNRNGGNYNNNNNNNNNNGLDNLNDEYDNNGDINIGNLQNDESFILDQIRIWNNSQNSDNSNLSDYIPDEKEDNLNGINDNRNSGINANNGNNNNNHNNNSNNNDSNSEEKQEEKAFMANLLNNGLRHEEIKSPIESVNGLSINLMNHQKIGVTWLLEMENNDNYRGGLLCDQMGVGKTIQTIALMYVVLNCSIYIYAYITHKTCCRVTWVSIIFCSV